jgi:hypothetical protein
MSKIKKEKDPKKIKKIKKKFSKKKDYFGLIPTLDATDKRIIRLVKQYKKKGFDDTVTWSLDLEISKFILPRLKLFKKISNGYPGHDITAQMWDSMLDKMILAHKLNIKDEWNPGEYEKYEEGMDLFCKWYRHLWW